MNALNPTSLLKKVAVLLGVAAATSLISFPVLAQINPNPSIFNEPQNNGVRCPDPGRGRSRGPDNLRALRLSLLPASCTARGRYREATYGGQPVRRPGKGKARHRRSVDAPAPGRGPAYGQPPAYNPALGGQPNYSPPAYSPAPPSQPNNSPPPVPLPVPQPPQ
jgi:hypothetical protein